jgi:hypothetical protein
LREGLVVLGRDQLERFETIRVLVDKSLDHVFADCVDVLHQSLEIRKYLAVHSLMYELALVALVLPPGNEGVVYMPSFQRSDVDQFAFGLEPANGFCHMA